MPKAKDGKEFPYTKEGLAQLASYNKKLNRKNKKMGNKDTTSKDKTESPYNKVRSDNVPST
jgi:hypothetical protein